MRTFALSGRNMFEELSVGIYKSIVERYEADARCVFVVADHKDGNKVKAMLGEGYDNVVYSYYGEYITENWDKYNLEMLKAYEEKYDCAPLWKYIYTDRYLIHRDYEYCVKVAAGLFDYWETLFEKYDVECFYDEAISTLHTYVAYLVGKKTGAKYFTQMMTRGSGTETKQHYIIDEPLQRNAYWEDDYKSKTFSTEQMKKAEEYLEIFEGLPDVPEFMRLYNANRPKMSIKNLLLYPLWIRQRFFNPYTQLKGSYIYYSSWETVMNPIKERRRYNRCKKYYRKADLTEKFVYFPLHFQPEASTIVCAQQYEKQQTIIDALAKSLPADHVLYVKEHYTGLGSREESFYHDMEKYPNVRIIDPFESSRQLIKHAQCVVTLTGTAGFESVLMRRPLIMAGDCFFYNAPGVMYTFDVFENYMDLVAGWKQPTREELLQYICEYLETARPGSSYIGHPGTYTKENFDLLADSFMEYMNR